MEPVRRSSTSLGVHLRRVKPVLTGHPALFWGISIPYIVSTCVASLVSDINYWHYFIAMRICSATASAMFIILSLFASYYGHQTLSRLSKSRDSFNYRQQLRVLIFICLVLFGCGTSLAFQAYFLDKIDNFYQIFLLCTSLYRVSGFFLTLGTAIYVWAATSRMQKTRSSGSGRGSTRSELPKSSDKCSSDLCKSSKSTSTSDEEEEEVGCGENKDQSV